MDDLAGIFEKVSQTADFIDHAVESVESTNGYGDTALHIVTCWGDLDSVKLLVSAGADINKKGESGFTPLHYAVEHEHPKIVEYLLQVGALSTRDEDGLKPTDLAKIHGNCKVLKAFNDRI